MQLPATLSCLGHEIDTSPEAFGQLASSRDLIGNPEALRQRINEDGYLNIDEVMAARRTVCQKLDEAGFLDRAYPMMDAVPKASPAETYHAEASGR